MRIFKIVSAIVPSLALLGGCAAQQKAPVVETPAVTEDEIWQAREAKEIGSATGEYAFWAEPGRSALAAQKTNGQQAATKALEKRSVKQQEEIAALKAENAELKTRLEALERKDK